MTTQTSAKFPVELETPALNLGQWWATNPPLMVALIASVAICLAALAGLVLDPQVITGVPAWIKPLKFGISSAIYCASFIWLLTFVKGHPRLTGLVSYATAISLVVELGIIILQILRGTTSHFNISTSFDATLWSLMASFIMVIFMAALLTAVLLMFQKMPGAFGWSLRLAVLLSIVGMGVAYLMTFRPSPAQQAAMAIGQAPAAFGAHSVGVEDGGPGLPFVGWSTVGGDLRIPHFVGLHALQVLPLLGFLLSRRKSLVEGQRMQLIWAAALGYLGLIGLLTWQALRGQSLIAPDGLTLAAFGVLVAVVAGLSGLILRKPQLAQDQLQPAS
jgi:hypothetical protein